MAVQPYSLFRSELSEFLGEMHKPPENRRRFDLRVLRRISIRLRMIEPLSRIHYLDRTGMVRKNVLAATKVLEELLAAQPVGSCGSPPQLLEYLLFLIVDRKYAKQIAGDLEEEYRTFIHPRFGLRRARIWYLKQVICSVPASWWRWARRFAALGSLAELIRIVLR